MASELLRLCVRCDRFAPGAVRDAITHLPELDGVRDDAVLVASELVTNAVMHSLCADDDLLEVLVMGDGRVRISVVDPGASGLSAQIADRPPQLGGMGLKVVQNVAREWGTERRSDGYEVWAEITNG